MSRNTENYANYTYDLVGEVASDQAYEWNETPRLNEQLGYAYDRAGNLTYRTNNALIENFRVNTVNELTNSTNGGTLTVVGTTCLLYTSWAFGMVKNSPSEGEERPAPNALVLLKKPASNP